MALPLLLEASRNTRPGNPARGVAERLMWIKVQGRDFLGIILFSEGSCHFALCFYAICFEISDDKYSSLDLQHCYKEALTRGKERCKGNKEIKLLGM